MVVFEVASKSNDDTVGELSLAGAIVEVAEGVVDDADFSRFNYQVLLPLQNPIQGRHENVLHPAFDFQLHVFRLLLEPRLGDSSHIDVLLRQEDHAQACYRRR